MSNDNLVGKKLADRYEILELIGTGGMASVYKAKCQLLQRFVAIKVLRDNLKDDEAVVKNFTREAQASASLSDTNIISVFDVGHEDGMDYMVMEYVDGITLKQYIKEKGALPWQEACDFGIQIGQALIAAHSQGIIHRDIKPQNVLMTNDRILKVTDFGIAKATAAETMIVGGNSAMGSVHYISPEQARGGYTDARSDIYSLGVVLYEMLTGKVPFDCETAVGVALMHIEKTAVPIRDINSNVPIDLCHIVEKSMSKEQVNRYQSAEELVNDLRAVLSGESLPSFTQDISSDLGETKIIDLSKTRNTLPEDIEEDEIYEEEIIQNKSNKKPKKVKKKKTPQQKKADNFATIMAFCTILLVIALGVGGYIFLRAGSGDTLAPDLKNMTIEEAQTLCNEKGIRISQEIEYSLSDDIEEGRIISQVPEARSILKRDEEIKIVVSIGSSGGSISVPFVKGMSAEDAIVKILDADLTYTIIDEASDKVAAGLVIRQSPEVGTKVEKDQVITLHVSTGKESAQTEQKTQVTVPKLSSMTKDQAQSELSKIGLNIGKVESTASDLPEGTVISQNPSSGQSVTKGSAVNLVLSSGKAENVQTQKPEQTAEPTKVPEKTESTKPETSGVTKTYSLSIPGTEGTSKVKITVNGDTYYENVHNKGDKISLDITSSGQTTIVAYVDGEIISNKTVDFK